MGKPENNGVALLDYKRVPTSIDAENHSDTRVKNKYTVNRTASGCVISRSLFCLLMTCVLLLLIGAVLTTYFLVPACTHSHVNSASEDDTSVLEAIMELPDESDRLPTTLLPVHYSIKIIPFIWEQNFTTSGEVIITVNSTENTNEITLHINDISIHEDSVRITDASDESAQIFSVMQHSYNTKHQTYTIILDDVLKKGLVYDIRIAFVGQLNDLLQGFYRISYIDYSNKRISWMAATQFSPTDARRAFPCFDEPAFKAKFSISLARWRNMTTRSNMEIISQNPVEGLDDWVWDHYNPTPVMSTYLVAMVVSDFLPFHVSTELSRTKSNISFSVWARKEALMQTRYASKIGLTILEYFERYFQIPYPLPKLDLMALPDFGFHAMENWGLITFRESSLLFDEKTTTIEHQRQIATVLSHELGHQWFGNLVTPEWWDDLWLKEGFATYTEYLGVSQVQPTWNILDEFVTDAIHSSFQIDCLKNSHPIHVPVKNTEQIRQIFDPISYKKGASIIRMVNYMLGESTFKNGLVKYLNAKKYSNAYHDDLWAELTRQGHMDGTLDMNFTLKEIMDTWILQTGFPVLNVSRNYEKNTVTIKQQRFLLSNKTTDDTTWWIPLSFTTSREFNFANTKPRLWMKNEQEITINNVTKNEWFYVNVKHGGYYRVNYDLQNWKMLKINYQRFPHVVRAQILDDAFALARANQLDYEVPFALAIETFRQTNYISMSTALRNFKFIDNMLAHTPIYGNFKLFMSQLTGAIYEGLGLEENPSDNYDTKMRRTEVLKWACSFENSDCIIQARQMFREWMVDEADDTNIVKTRLVPPNLKATVYCTAIREGGEAEWDFAFMKYLRTNIGTEKEVLLTALGCASEPWILSKYLDRALSNSSGIRKQDGSIVFKSVADNVAGHQIAFDFIRTNWQRLNDHYGKGFSTISKMVSSLSTFMNTPYDLYELENFKRANANDLGTAERALEQTIEIVGYNVEWMKHSYKQIQNWLHDTIKKYGLHSYHFNK